MAGDAWLEELSQGHRICERALKFLKDILRQKALKNIEGHGCHNVNSK